MKLKPRYKLAFGVLISILILSPISIEREHLSITLQTLVIFLGASLVPWRISVLVILIYLLLGALGLPVFSEYSSGVDKLYGNSAGFLWGFVLCAVLVSKAFEAWELGYLKAIAVFLTAHVILLIPGLLVLHHLKAELHIWSITVGLLPGLILKSTVGGFLAVLLRNSPIHKD